MRQFRELRSRIAHKQINYQGDPLTFQSDNAFRLALRLTMRRHKQAVG